MQYHVTVYTTSAGISAEAAVSGPMGAPIVQPRGGDVASTIRDVAREAGVSMATVSRVFNNSGQVHEDTRRRIDDVAKRLRYIRNVAARTLSTRRTQTIGVVLPHLSASSSPK